LVATPALDIALTFPENRVLLVPDHDTPITAGFHGRPTAVALIVPPWMRNEDTEKIRLAFVNLTEWTRIPLKSAPSMAFWLGR
jgi:hypothetical protein